MSFSTVIFSKFQCYPEGEDNGGDTPVSVVSDTSEGFSSCWPFVTFKGLQGNQILFNALT